MLHFPAMTRPSPQDDVRRRRLGPGGWLAIAVLAGLLVWAGWLAVHMWTSLPGVEISPLGWLFMILAAVLTFALGAGLMWLVFYSSRHHYDE